MMNMIDPQFLVFVAFNRPRSGGDQVLAGCYSGCRHITPPRSHLFLATGHMRLDRNADSLKSGLHQRQRSICDRQKRTRANKCFSPSK
jgi:hypothetical protein